MQIDPKLIADCILQNRKSQLALYRQCYGFMMNVCKRYTNNHDDAKALVNIGFLKVLSKLDQHLPDKKFEAWLRKIMINTALDEYRKNLKNSKSIEYHEPETLLQHDQPFTHDEIEVISAEQIEVFMRKLPPMGNRVFNLFAIDGYSHKEIADMLGIKESTSRWYLSEARESLKKMINAFIQKKKIYESV